MVHAYFRWVDAADAGIFLSTIFQQGFWQIPNSRVDHKGYHDRIGMELFHHAVVAFTNTKMDQQVQRKKWQCIATGDRFITRDKNNCTAELATFAATKKMAAL